MIRPYLEKKGTQLRTPVSAEVQIGSFLYFVSDEGRYRKTANAFGISRASVSGVIRRESYAITKSVDPKLIRSPTSQEEFQVLTDRYLEAHGFLQCIGAIDGTHIEIAEPSEHYSDFINRKSYFSLNVKAVCDDKYCFKDVVLKWSGSVHDARTFLYSSNNGILRNRTIPL